MDRMGRICHSHAPTVSIALWHAVFDKPPLSASEIRLVCHIVFNHTCVRAHLTELCKKL